MKESGQSPLFLSLSLSLLQGSLKVIAGVCEMAAGKSLPIAPPTDTTEAAVAENEFQDTFSPSPQQPTTMTSNELSPHNSSVMLMMKSQVGEEEMENFEADLLAQETEDRLTQLMLDDELSDARLGLTMEPEPGALSHAASMPSFSSSVVMDQAPSIGDKTLLEVTKQGLAASQEQLHDRGVHVGSKSVVMTTHQELTLDVKEKERLEDRLIIAG